MDLVIILLVGALIGWVASLIMGTDQQQGAIANVLIGIVGAFLGRWLFADVLGIGGATAAGALSLSGLFWGIVGAILLIGILRAVKVLR
ncbi:MAG TPA: GlsB/YeaQ/YmgE family stress response membrane protein [Patescibacteria group bacterium]